MHLQTGGTIISSLRKTRGGMNRICGRISVTASLQIAMRSVTSAHGNTSLSHVLECESKSRREPYKRQNF
jgi:hypothetical protein